jgi:hypothetical protein
MSSFDAILFDRAEVHPGMVFDPIPTKWCVAVLWDADGRPVQAVISKALRAWLRRRLDEPLEPTRRADVKSIVRSISWRRVTSAIEADLVFLDVVRACFPDRWERLVPERRAWFVAVDAESPVPRLRRVDLPEGSCVYGPFTDKSAADRWIEHATDVFDLCRFNHILEQAPTGVACMYKQLGRCDAPCDGSVTMQHYRLRIADAMRTIDHPTSQIEQLRLRMKTQAGEQRFEEAAQSKQRLDRLEKLGEAGRIESFAMYVVTPGMRKGQAKLLRLDAQGWRHLLSFVAPVRELPRLDVSADASSNDPALMGLIAWHRVRKEPGVAWVESARLGVPAVNRILRDDPESEPIAADASMEG